MLKDSLTENIKVDENFKKSNIQSCGQAQKCCFTRIKRKLQ